MKKLSLKPLLIISLIVLNLSFNYSLKADSKEFSILIGGILKKYLNSEAREQHLDPAELLDPEEYVSDETSSRSRQLEICGDGVRWTGDFLRKYGALTYTQWLEGEDPIYDSKGNTVSKMAATVASSSVIKYIVKKIPVDCGQVAGVLRTGGAYISGGETPTLERDLFKALIAEYELNSRNGDFRVFNLAEEKKYDNLSSLFSIGLPIVVHQIIEFYKTSDKKDANDIRKTIKDILTYIFLRGVSGDEERGKGFLARSHERNKFALFVDFFILLAAKREGKDWQEYESLLDFNKAGFEIKEIISEFEKILGKLAILKRVPFLPKDRAALEVQSTEENAHFSELELFTDFYRSLPGKPITTTNSNIMIDVDIE